jgi:hypothetical protein
MSANLLRLGLAMSAISVVMVAFLYYQLPHKFASVSACRARLAQLERIAAQNSSNEAALDEKEKALDAAEAQLNNVKQ